MIYLFLAAVVFGMNLVPAFMPATWMVLAFFFLKFHLQLWLVVMIGATMATGGRVGLYFLSKVYFSQLLSLKGKRNYQALGNYLVKKRKLTVILVLTYAFLPIPSNQVFIAAGLAEINIKIIALAFFVGRLVSYTFWVSLASGLASDMTGIVGGYHGNLSKMLLQGAGLGIIYLISRIDWLKRLPKR